MTRLVVDAHVHIWGSELLDVPWLQDPAVAVLRREFTLDELTPALDAAGVDRVVLVAAEETLAGTRLLLERAAGDSRVGGVVGWVNLTERFAATELAHLRSMTGGSLLCGIRQSTAEWQDSHWSALESNLAELEHRDLVLELLSPAVQLDRVAALASDWPELRIVVDHLGLPATPEDPTWRSALDALVAHPSVAVKVSSLPFDEREVGSAVEYARSALGADRLIAGSDWPVVLRRASAVDEWARLHRVVAQWLPAERDAVLGSTAARFYRIAA